MFRPKSAFLRVSLAIVYIVAGGLFLYSTLYAALLAINLWLDGWNIGLITKIGRSIGVLLGIGLVAFFWSAAYRLLRPVRKKMETGEEEVVTKGKMIFRILWGIGCFFMSGCSAFIVLMNIVTIHKGRIGVSFQMGTAAAIALVFFTIATVFFLWRGIRWLKFPQKEKGPIELLGEEF